MLSSDCETKTSCTQKLKVSRKRKRQTLDDWVDKNKLACFLAAGNKLEPHEVSLGSGKKFKFKCSQCPHTFESAPNNVTTTKRPRWCPYCARKKLCGDVKCRHCLDRSLSSWSDPLKLACFLAAGNKVEPHEISLRNGKKFKFKCDQCPHTFESVIGNVTSTKSPTWCPYCSGRSLCGDIDCRHCLDRSLASWSEPIKLACFIAASNELEPHEVSLGSNQKFKFKCSQCPHTFESLLSGVTNQKSPTWCPYCAGRNLCGDIDCRHCLDRSLASWSDTRKLACFLAANNKVEPHEVGLGSHKKFKFKCDKCTHTFGSAPHNVTKTKDPIWCPYCARKKLCGDVKCGHCLYRSLSSWSDLRKLACFIAAGNELEPHQISLGSQQKFKFKCDQCPHTFESSIKTVTKTKKPSWCPCCAGRVCGDPKCTECSSACDVCRGEDRIVKGYFRTPDPEFPNMCRDHYITSGHAPPNLRAKVTLEIYMFAEIQRQALKTSYMFIWNLPTSWDCAILPGLSYKPDNIWVFGQEDVLLQTTGACKLNKGEVRHVMILEILEVGILQHSEARHIPDAEREKQIRAVFYPHPVGFLYVTIAAYNHRSAHRDDQFFAKQDPGSFEYSVVKSRLPAFQARVGVVLKTLDRMRVEKSNTTIWIGH
jgi:hypothetical protein